MNKLLTVPPQCSRAISPRATAFDSRGHPACLVRHIDFLNMVAPDFAMSNAVSGDKYLMQASPRGANSRPIVATKLIEMERDKFVSIRILTTDTDIG